MKRGRTWTFWATLLTPLAVLATTGLSDSWLQMCSSRALKQFEQSSFFQAFCTKCLHCVDILSRPPLTASCRQAGAATARTEGLLTRFKVPVGLCPCARARASVCMALGGGGWVGEWDQVELSGSAAPLPATRPVIIREASATRNPLAREWRGKLSASKREMEMDVCKAKAMGEQQPEHNVSIT
jgi:hypothetical protein